MTVSINEEDICKLLIKVDIALDACCFLYIKNILKRLLGKSRVSFSEWMLQRIALKHNDDNVPTFKIHIFGKPLKGGKTKKNFLFIIIVKKIRYS